jgi:hypothetical protein
MRSAFMLVAALGAATAAGVAWWRQHPRFGSAFMNRIVDPWLVRRGIVDKSHGEIGLVEHVGRRSRVVRVSPIHPVPTEVGFRIIVPLGGESHWVRNVLSEGRCRIQIGDVVHELDEPVLVLPSTIEGLPRLTPRIMEWLGFRYLLLHRLGEHAGTLTVPADPVTSAEAQAAGVH